MCLKAEKDKLKDESIFKFNKDGWVYCYKVYGSKNGVLKPWLYGSRNIKHGWIVSNRQTTRVPISSDSTYCYNGRKLIVNRGIHVSLTIANAEVNRDDNDVIVKLRCYKKDLVATGVGYLNSRTEAVFNKVFLDEKEYNRVIRK